MALKTTGEEKFLTEVPSSLKQLARLVVRGFYTIEDSLIIDMLVRNPCMKEDDIAELLRFEKKQIRARISTLRNDKFIQIRLKMETGPDGKAQKVNYYFINYKSFVNVVKYKLDIMRKRMETEERDATSRASFRCINCIKTFTDLEADQLFDNASQEFHCTYCGHKVEEDNSALPKKDSRLMLARFNDQLQPLYDLLKEVENVKLAPEILEPEPVTIDAIRGVNKSLLPRVDGLQWSGEATRNQGLAVEETRVDISIDGGSDDTSDSPLLVERKARPIWMTESTITTEGSQDNVTCSDSINVIQAQSIGSGNSSNIRNKKETEDIMSVLLQHERQSSANKITFGKRHRLISSELSDEDNDTDFVKVSNSDHLYSDTDSDGDMDAPIVFVSGTPYPVTQMNDNIIARMTPQEKENYIHVYQQHFSDIYD